jgi:hypothetical protein
VSTPENDDKDFHFDLLTSGPKKSYARPIGIVAAILGIIFIFATMFSNVANRILPMNDAYLNVLVPAAADGSEAISLQKLEHEVVDKTVTIRGTVGNRTEYPLRDILAVIEVQESTGILRDTLEVPLDPPEVPPQGTATFQGMVTVDELGGYIVKFKVLDGPFAPHKDDRAAMFSLPPGK